jgi:hypothetical protein
MESVNTALQITDGYLFSFSPVYSEKKQMSTGLSLHFDLVAQSKLESNDSFTIENYSNALNWTVKLRHVFSEGVTFQFKGHAGCTFYGVSYLYSPTGNIDDHITNYGAGLNIKTFFILELGRAGVFEISNLGYALWPYPAIDGVPEGASCWLFSDVTYSWFFTTHISIGAGASYALEYSSFSGHPNVLKQNIGGKMFLAWSL